MLSINNWYGILTKYSAWNIFFWEIEKLFILFVKVCKTTLSRYIFPSTSQWKPSRQFDKMSSIIRDIVKTFPKVENLCQVFPKNNWLISYNYKPHKNSGANDIINIVIHVHINEGEISTSKFIVIRLYPLGEWKVCRVCTYLSSQINYILLYTVNLVHQQAISVLLIFVTLS